MPVTYYTEEEFGEVVSKKLIAACIELDATPVRDMTFVTWNDGSMEYALKGVPVLKTKREAQGFVIVFSKEEGNSLP